MSNIAKIIGNRIRNHRNRHGLSQEELAEKAGLHNTYIGQLERGEKNATLESIEKIVKALNISYETLFEKINNDNNNSISLRCYELVDELNVKEQQAIYEILEKTINYRKASF